ncbi:MAG: hypothetical protein GVY36_03490 [Verrucomicrobia bacterium]|jgi:hypothetical protein|nr:hypothetical protein [Verrucomicrobiota bacterium]
MENKNRATGWFGYLVLTASGAGMVVPVESAPESGPWEGELTSFWESRYVDSGRDELPEGGLWTLEGQLHHGSFELEAWLGVGDSVDYRELNLSAGYSASVGEVDWGFAYTRLEFKGEAPDDELELALEGPLVGGFGWSAGSVYSFGAEGSFVEIGLQYPLDAFWGRLQLTPRVTQGFDFGYRTAVHDGPNHLQVGVDWTWLLDDVWQLHGHLTHSFAGTDVRREGLGGHSWVGFGLSAGF